MKISRNWLQNYFEKPLPGTEVLEEALTFHAFEVEERTGDTLEIKILPDRAADCLCHRGIARELGAILDISLSHDPLREPLAQFLKTDDLAVSIEDSQTCLRYIGALVRGVKVGPSPMWLREALEAVGQRSINNIVDATNFVMFNIGQPLHAFDAGKLAKKDGAYRIAVRPAHEGEKITTLSGEEYALSTDTLLVADDNAGAPLGIAGIKGGKVAEVDNSTKDIIIEAANFDGPSIRRTAQKLKLFTDASARFQNKPSSELPAYGMRDVLVLITKIAGGEVIGVVDTAEGRPARPTAAPAKVTLSRINNVLGTQLSNDDVARVFARLGLDTKHEGDTFTVTPPFERIDLTIPEDLIEEVGRIEGYEKIASAPLPTSTEAPDQDRYRGIERMKDMLVEQGFTEVSTQSFAPRGDIVLANPLDATKPALRTTLADNLAVALAQAKQYAPLTLGPNAAPKLFEVGTVFPKEGEYLELRMTERVPEWGDAAGVVDNLSVAKLEEYGRGYEPKRYALSTYHPFSVYPFIVRDVAVFVPPVVTEVEVEHVIKSAMGALVVRGPELFDRFEKKNKETGVTKKISYAFRLVLQSIERTLTDDEANAVMAGVVAALEKYEGWQVR